MTTKDSGSTPAASTKIDGENRGETNTRDKTRDKIRPGPGVVGPRRSRDLQAMGSTLLNLARCCEGPLRAAFRDRHALAAQLSIPRATAAAYVHRFLAELRALRWAAGIAQAATPQPGPAGLAACPWCRRSGTADLRLREPMAFLICGRCGATGPMVFASGSREHGWAADLQAEARRRWNAWGTGVQP